MSGGVFENSDKLAYGTALYPIFKLENIMNKLHIIIISICLIVLNGCIFGYIETDELYELTSSKCENGFSGDVILSDEVDSSFEEFTKSGCRWIRGNLFVRNYSGEFLPDEILNLEKIDLNLQIENANNLKSIEFPNLMHSYLIYIADNASLKHIGFGDMQYSMAYIIDSNYSLEYFSSSAKEIGFIEIYNNANLKHFFMPHLININKVEFCNNPNLQSKYIDRLIRLADGFYETCTR